MQAKSLHDRTFFLKISRKSTEKWLRKTRVLPRKIIMKKENAYNNSKVFRRRRKILIKKKENANNNSKVFRWKRKTLTRRRI